MDDERRRLVTASYPIGSGAVGNGERLGVVAEGVTEPLRLFAITAPGLAPLAAARSLGVGVAGAVVR